MLFCSSYNARFRDFKSAFKLGFRHLRLRLYLNIRALKPRKAKFRRAFLDTSLDIYTSLTINRIFILNLLLKVF